MSSSYHNRTNQKPENALKRAEELLGLGRKVQALDALSIIATRRQKTWTKKLEELMFKFLSLCVELSKAVKAKDGLYHFRNVSLQQPQSLENVLKHFIQVSEQQAETVQSGIEDPLFKISLDPSLVGLIKSVSLEEHNRQADSEKVKPWLKFLWETYRTVLDILRNNPKLEPLYKDTAKKAFDYCVKYNRTNEFRRLADLLRNHLLKHNNQYFESEESITFQLEIRFGQLNTAVALELWQEAYKSIEDINNNLILPAKIPIPKDMLVNYYRQLEKLFWVSKNYMLHTEALLKYTDLKIEVNEENLANMEESLELAAESEREERKNAIEEFKKKAAEEQETLYSRVVLAALSIPLSEKPEDPFVITYDLQKEKEARLAQLLDFEVHPNRAYLLESLVASDIFQSCHPNIQAIYELFEVKTQLFQFAKDVNNALGFLDQSDHYRQYHQPLFNISFIRLLQQLAGVYQTMEFKQLLRLVPNLTFHDIEKRIVLAHRAGTVDCRIDHRCGVLHFNMSNLETDDVKLKIVNVAKNLRKVAQIVKPASQAEETQARLEIYQRVAGNLRSERERLLNRQAEIEKIKDQREERANLLANAIAQLKRRNDEAEKAELEKRQRQKKIEHEEKERQKLQEFQVAQRTSQVVAQLTKIANATGTSKAKKMASKLQQAESQAVIDQEDFVKSQLERLVVERRKHEQTLSQASLRQDHWVRALRELEKPILESIVAKYKEEDKALFQTGQEEARKEHQQRFDQQQSIKSALLPIMDDWPSFQAKLDLKSEDEYKKKTSTRDAKVSEWREKRIKELQEEQKRRNAEIARQQEQERRQKEEERRREEERAKEEARRLEEAEQQRQEQQRQEQQRQEQQRQEQQRQEQQRQRPDGPKRPWVAETKESGRQEREPFSGGRPGREPPSRSETGAWRRETTSTSSAPKPWENMPTKTEPGAARPGGRPEAGRPEAGRPESGKPGSRPWDTKGGSEASSRQTEGSRTESGAPRPFRTEGSGRPYNGGPKADDGAKWRRDDAFREAPRGDGYGRRDAPRGDGPRRDGPRGDGPRGDGPRDDGSRDDGPRGDGPRGDGPRGDGPRGNGRRPWDTNNNNNKSPSPPASEEVDGWKTQNKRR